MVWHKMPLLVARNMTGNALRSPSQTPTSVAANTSGDGQTSCQNIKTQLAWFWYNWRNWRRPVFLWKYLLLFARMVEKLPISPQLYPGVSHLPLLHCRLIAAQLAAQSSKSLTKGTGLDLEVVPVHRMLVAHCSSKTEVSLHCTLYV